MSGIGVLMPITRRKAAGGRQAAATRHVDGCGPRRLARAEGLTAPARGHGVRVLDREASARHRIEEVHLRPAQVPDADGIDIQFDAVRFEHLIDPVVPEALSILWSSTSLRASLMVTSILLTIVCTSC